MSNNWIKTNCIFMVFAAIVMLGGCSSTDSVAEFKSAVTLFEQQDYPAALEKARLCLRIDREDVEVIKLYALCAFSYDAPKEDRTRAIHNLRRAATTLGKDDYEIHYFLGWAHFQEYSFSDAQQSLENSFKLMKQSLPSQEMTQKPMYAHLLFMLGLCYVQSNLPAGLDYLRALENVKPYCQWPEYYASYALLAYRLNRYQEAILWYRKANKIAPQLPEPYLNIAVIYDTVFRSAQSARQWYVPALGLYMKQGNSYYKQKIQRRLRVMSAPGV